MRLMLCSDFSGVGKRYLNRFFKKLNNLNCLFVPYAEEDDEISSAEEFFKEQGVNVIRLSEGYEFNDKIDMIFVRGGNTTRLIHYLRMFGQYEKIKELVQSGVLYIGNSAGSVLVGTDTAWTLESEPYSVDLVSMYGKNALEGFGFIDKFVFVHCSKYRMCRKYEQTSPEDIFRTLDLDCYPAYLKDIKKYKKNEYIRIGNNQVYIVDGDKSKTVTYNWYKILVKH